MPRRLKSSSPWHEGFRTGVVYRRSRQAEVTCTPLEMNDASRPAAKVVFNGASAERLSGIDGWDAYQELLDRAAVLMAFEQIGGAKRV